MVFVVYGYNHIGNYHFHLDFLNIIVNPFPHIINRVNKALCNSLSEDIFVRVLVRNIVTVDDFDRVKANMVSVQRPDRIRYLYYDIMDYENAMKCQISQNISFKKISAGMKKIIMSDLGDILPDIKPKKIRKAFYIARKGEKHR